ncbi:exodeoxyribonuclease III [Brucepastera parasyntrophica]|uniref:exodeoxyribonuclease III n=1 Tax=Brucepastera parasyntrophica TaxID=2880008 RepID=UPI00210CA4DE|nr:exodeoxyribonuclease III [Brucepastera parasyntrophica]ULQ58504.1 exodeoxyribonuclease III [Brucepastera parasyntrophica]
MKLVSWNVNGLRAALNRGFIDAVNGLNADIICLQETKMEQGQAVIDLVGYHEYWNSADKKGYSGTAVFSRSGPVRVQYDMGLPEHDTEGRIIQAEYEDFILVNVYTPNSKRGLLRLPYRMEWEDAFRNYLVKLDKQKPVVICGDLNVAHEEIDIKNVASNRKNAGFTDEERARMTELLSAGFSDTFRTLHPDTVAYSWWSYMGNARANNVGWRLDYFLVSNRLMPKVKAAEIYNTVEGSDHCPVGLVLDV